MEKKGALLLLASALVLAGTAGSNLFSSDLSGDAEKLKFSHFFNGSYSANDIIEELISNKSLHIASPRKRYIHKQLV